MGNDHGLYCIYSPTTQTISTTKNAAIGEEPHPFLRNEEDEKGSHWKKTERRTLTSEIEYDDTMTNYGQEFDSNQPHLVQSQQDTENARKNM